MFLIVVFQCVRLIVFLYLYAFLSNCSFYAMCVSFRQFLSLTCTFLPIVSSLTRRPLPRVLLITHLSPCCCCSSLIRTGSFLCDGPPPVPGSDNPPPLVSSPPSRRPRDHLQLGVQQVPVVRGGGQPALHLPADGQPVHLQGPAVRRGQLHLPGEEQRHQRPGPQPPHAPHAQDGR